MYQPKNEWSIPKKGQRFYYLSFYVKDVYGPIVRINSAPFDDNSLIGLMLFNSHNCHESKANIYRSKGWCTTEHSCLFHHWRNLAKKQKDVYENWKKSTLKRDRTTKIENYDNWIPLQGEPFYYFSHKNDKGEWVILKEWLGFDSDSIQDLINVKHQNCFKTKKIAKENASKIDEKYNELLKKYQEESDTYE